MSCPAVLFVCLGNICRSPLAEAAFRAEAEKVGLEVQVDSAGTGAWHVGNPPDRRAQAVARRNGIEIGNLRARQVHLSDFTRFTHIIALDRHNLADIRRLAPSGATAEIGLLLDHLPGREGQPVADPYYGHEDAFEMTWAIVQEASRQLVARLAGTS